MIRSLISEFLYRKYNQSFSQCGEDMILAYLFPKKNGVFVDIGAYHPYKFSNTFLFYKKGWRGINIDASPGSMNLFNRIRSEDINIEAAISDESKELIYYQIDPGSSMNSFDKENLVKLGIIDQVKREIPIKTQRLDEVIGAAKVFSVSEIDFFSVDVEGFEMNVLKSNDWNRFRPKVILIENFETLEAVCRSDFEFSNYLEQYNYNLLIKTPNSLFYCRSDLKFSPTNSLVFF